MKRAEKREYLVEIAARLFNRCGFHATGIDTIIAEAGIAKTTLYRHFETKEDLIVAALRRLDDRYREDMRRHVEQVPVNQRLLATFDFLHAWFADKAFHGCPFVSAAGEYSDRRSPVFKESLMHKRLLLAYFEELARAGGFADAPAVAQTINLLHEGAIAVAHISGDPEAARRARALAETLVASRHQAGS